MEYFIVEEGYMWNTILSILRQKARQGVEVRFDILCLASFVPGWNFT